MSSKLNLPIKAVPYKHQIEAFNYVCSLFGLTTGIVKSSGAALLMEMGTGKTLTTIAVIGALFKAEKIKKALIVAPLSIVGVWLEELQKFADFNYNAKIIKGSTAAKQKILTELHGPQLQIAIINYESAWRMLRELKAFNPDIIIADEGHKIKDARAKQSQALHTLGYKTPYKMLLTGTIIANKAIDVFSQYKFVNPSIFGFKFNDFRNKYFIMGGYKNYEPFLNPVMEHQLMAKMHSIAFRATKEQCLDLPEKIDIVRNITLEPYAMKLYKNVVKDSYAELMQGEVSARNVLTKLLRLSQLTGGFVTDDLENVISVSKAKLDALEDIISETILDGKKIVIIARFIPEIEAIKKLARCMNIRFSCIQGGVSDRELQVSEFQNNPDVKVFIGQIATAGLGITLTAASTMVFYSLDYSMSNFEQTKARIHRVGQKNSCTYLYLVARGTVDEKILIAQHNKYDVAKHLVDEFNSGANPFIGADDDA